MVSRGIARAQKKVEQRNFDIRKSLLEYDEVMDKQRKFIYGQRNEVLEGTGLKDKILGMFEQELEEELAASAAPDADEIDWKSIDEWLHRRLGQLVDTASLRDVDPEQLFDKMVDLIEARWTVREAEIGTEDFENLCRFLLLDAMDSKWKDHLRAMDALKDGIGLRGYAQVYVAAMNEAPCSHRQHLRYAIGISPSAACRRCYAVRRTEAVGDAAWIQKARFEPGTSDSARNL